MQDQIGSARHLKHLLLIVSTVLGVLLASSASASAKTTPEITLSVQTVGVSGTALTPSLAYARAIQAAAAPGEAREAISITSATPSVCVVLGYVWGPGELLPPEREMEAEVWVYGNGSCTLIASVKATSTTEAAEASKSFTASGPPVLEEAAKQPTIPEVTFAPPGQTYLASPLTIEAKATRPGLSVSSSTPAVCSVSPSQTARLDVVVDLMSTGTCTLIASLPKTAEAQEVTITKSILIAKVSFTSTPPSSAIAGGSYEVTATAAPGLEVRLGLQGNACTFYKPSVEQSLPAQGHSEPAPRWDAPATVYFLRAGTCTITAEGYGASERISQSFTVAAGAPEQIEFTTRTPEDAVVGDSYSPTVRSSLGWPVEFSSATQSVCKIVLGSSATESETINGVHLPLSSVQFIAPGVCTVVVKTLEGTGVEVLEAQQSFAVKANEEAVSLPPAPEPGRPAETQNTLSPAAAGGTKTSRPLPPAAAGGTKPPSQTDIPAHLRHVLLQKARSEAAKHGDRHPYDIRGVAAELESPRVAPHGLVYLVSIRGRFPHPCHGGPTCSPDSVIWIAVLASNERVLDFGARYPYESLKKMAGQSDGIRIVGVPVRLSAKKT